MEATAPGCRLNGKGFVGQLVREAAGEAAKLLGFEWPSGFYIIIQMLPRNLWESITFQALAAPSLLLGPSN